MEAAATKFRSAVLIPCQEYRDAGFCPADIVGGTSQCPNGAVDVFDLLEVLANWDTAGLGAAIAAPFNIVDVFDLLEVLAEWGDCDLLPSQTVNTLQTEVTNAGLTMDDWDDFQDVMTDSQVPAGTKANWNCWMKRYLTGCVVCQPCRGPDPFD